MDDWKRVTELIEDGLEADHIDAGELARALHMSEHHFRRMFSTLAGLPVSEYVRRRRMTVAAAALIAGDGILDVAVRYGYGSAEAFTRAFRAVHGVTPSQARLSGTSLRSQPRLRFSVQVSGGDPVDHRIIKKDQFRIIGKKARVPLVYEGPNTAMEEFERSLGTDVNATLLGLSDQEPHGILGVCSSFDERRAEGSHLDYWRAVASSALAPGGFDSLNVDAGLWAVFSNEGPFPEAMQQMWAAAGSEWFPANPYEWADGPEILRVADLDVEAGTCRGELWLPITPAC
ncbi:AraC family transcriptional regulator [Gordonia iterans]|uniref:AraC family transcriptional regulator n=2 Tax=Gordonia iterans TaxID=1004901 RepID=A0A2S0KJU4_9ACTN|nr:AraC family transcriptional regulator [Gordonia iterans]